MRIWHLRDSLDHLVGAGDERGRKLEAKRLGSFEVHDEIELRGLQYRQISRFLALEDACSVDANLPVCVSNIRPIADQATFVGIFTELIDGGQLGLRRKFNNTSAARIKKRIRGNKQSANARALYHMKGFNHFVVIASRSDQ